MQVAPPGSNALSSPILYHRPPRRVYSQSSQKTAQLFGGEGADLAEQGSTSPSFTGFPCAPPMLPSQSQGACAPCDSSPAGGAKCQPVGKGEVCGKGKPEKTPPYHQLWAGERTCTCLPRGGGGMSRQRHAGEGSKNTKTMWGAGLAASSPHGTLSFVTQCFFCFGAINNRRSFICRHIERAVPTGSL